MLVSYMYLYEGDAGHLLSPNMMLVSYLHECVEAIEKRVSVGRVCDERHRVGQLTAGADRQQVPAVSFRQLALASPCVCLD